MLCEKVTQIHSPKNTSCLIKNAPNEFHTYGKQACHLGWRVEKKEKEMGINKITNTLKEEWWKAEKMLNDDVY